MKIKMWKVNLIVGSILIISYFVLESVQLILLLIGIALILLGVFRKIKG